MKAFVVPQYGSPDTLQLTDTERPVPGDDEILVRVRATSVQPYDLHHLRGEPYLARLMPGTMGLRGPKFDILGVDVAGLVESVGASVTEFQPGDDVFAMLRGGGGFGVYVCAKENELWRKPQNLSYEQAAAVPMAARTALLALRESGRVGRGQRVLVNGASGGVGTFAVQLARAFGAEVTAVCSARNADLVRSIGAETVVDYTSEDFTRTGQTHDVVLDLAGSRSGWASRRVLTHKGTLVLVGGPKGRWLQPVGHGIATLAMSPFVSQRVVRVDVVASTATQQHLKTLAELIEGGTIAPVIDRVFPFDDLPAAVAYQEQGHARGKVVVAI